MKHHYIIKVTEDAHNTILARVAHWQTFISDKRNTITSFLPTIDALFANNNIPFWLTTEYAPQAQLWSADEMATGLHRTYRLICATENKLPERSILQLQQLTVVETARELAIVESELPQKQAPLATASSMQNSTTIATTIKLPFAHAHTKGEANIKIAVLDTGVNVSHQELQGKIKYKADWVDLKGLDASAFIGDTKDYDEDPEDEVGHGTHVAGIIAAHGHQMEEGVAPQCSLMIARVLATMKDGNRKVGAGIVDNINNGIKWAVDKGADVINMSLGIKHTDGGLPHEDVIKYALKKNVTIVAASGNDGTSEKYYPGALPNVIAVGATDTNGKVTSFTSYGANITVVAPGVRLYSSYAHNSYAYASGTSQASPVVAGAIALLKSYAKQKGIRLKPEHINHILATTSDKPDTKFKTPKAGYGMLNITDAFKYLKHNF